jgi:hypothetical protein
LGGVVLVATITRHGRWSYWISIDDGQMRYEPDGVPWVRCTWRRAYRLARRELARYGGHPTDIVYADPWNLDD